MTKIKRKNIEFFSKNINIKNRNRTVNKNKYIS